MKKFDDPTSYHYVDSVSSLQKELKECMSEVEQIEARVNDNSSKKRSGLTIKEEEEEQQQQEEKQEVPATTLERAIF
jgi:predicted RNA-binding protein with RPS1 domain